MRVRTDVGLEELLDLDVDRRNAGDVNQIPKTVPPNVRTPCRARVQTDSDRKVVGLSINQWKLVAKLSKIVDSLVCEHVSAITRPGVL